MNRKTKLLVAAAAIAVAPLTMASGCDDGSKPSAQTAGQQQTETAFQQQSAAVPYPAAQLKDSLERRNIRERLLRTNDPNKLQYVYVLSYDGKYLGFYAIKGKVSSTQSQMTTTDLIRPCSSGGDGGSGNCAVTVPAPGDDGSYGDNEPGVFFFTTEGVMVTTDMPYVVSDAPLNIQAPKLNPPKG